MAKAATDKPKPMSKSEIVASLAESTGLGKKEVVSVLDGLEALIGTSLGKKGSGVFALPGLLKIQFRPRSQPPRRKGSILAPARRSPSRPSRLARSSRSVLSRSSRK